MSSFQYQEHSNILESEKEQLVRIIEERINPYDQVDPLSLPEGLWGNLYWDFMSSKKRNEILIKLLNAVFERAKKNIPIYGNSKTYSNLKLRLEKFEDMLKLPILLKDSPNYGNNIGFREKIMKDRLLLRPKDIVVSMAYESGGTNGMPTPTYIGIRDLTIEATALAKRCFIPGNLTSNGVLYNFYNPTHKGGKMIELAGNLLHSKIIITKRPEDGLKDCIEKIKTYGVNSIATVQPPLEEHSSKKSAGVTFLDLYGGSHELFGSVGEIKNAFITGYSIPQEVLNLCNEIKLNIFTTWGASEALPGATSTVIGPDNRLCQGNSQHLLHGPHILSVVKEKDGELVFAKNNEEGIVLVTTVAREGTIYLNYAIGDKATLITKKCSCGRTTPIIKNIHRADNPSDLLMAGCRYC